MDPLVLTKLNKAKLNRKAAVVVTHLKDGRDRLVLETDTVEGLLGEEIRKCFLSGKSKKLAVSDEPVFINVHVPSPRLFVIGAVHISQALVPMATMAGFEVTVIDPRTAFASQERFSGAALFADWPENVLRDNPLDPFTALAAVTHDPKIDDDPIIEALKERCFYVGALGSRKTHGQRLERLHGKGVSDEQLQNIRAPIGLDIGAASPQEIAVSILAEIIETLRKRETADP